MSLIIFTAEHVFSPTAFMYWGLLTVLIYIALCGLDKQYKVVYKFEDFYNLGKTKWLFCFYNRKSGKIAKYIFWLNIASHIIVVLSMISLIMYEINPNRINGILSVVLTYIGLFVILFIISIPGMHYYKKHEKLKVSEKTED